MKAVIFNSGLGNRMGEFTKTHHKSMARLQNGETIFGRQIRILRDFGIREFVVTTGPFAEQLHAVSEAFPDVSFTFVPNPIYDQTNYIYSMYLAREYLQDDLLLLHGDLVFNEHLIARMLQDPSPDLGMVSREKPQPEKDFKARVKNGEIQEVSIHIFDKDCFAFQALYKLSRATAAAWLARVCDFIAAGNDKGYAENAFNEILPSLHVRAFSYAGDYVDEVDNLADLARVSAEIRPFDFAGQKIASDVNAGEQIGKILEQCGARRPMLVCGHSFAKSFLREELKALPVSFVKFTEFSPNPKLSEIEKGLALFRKEHCDMVVSVGGGSAIDTAKCIQLFAALPEGEALIRKTYPYTPVRHLAVPTTAGTGSESTRFSVIYVNGEKHSVAHDCILPNFVVLDSRLLKSLPEYQKKATFLDALCQCIEAVWSVNSSAPCRAYAQEGMQLLLENWEAYLCGDEAASRKVLLGANYSGRAINLSQTTAAHAMSYKMTSLYGIAHGHAVALCLPQVWKYLLAHRSESALPPEHLASAFAVYEQAFHAATPEDAEAAFETLLAKMELAVPALGGPENLETLVAAVNPERLGNSPVPMDADAIRALYRAVFAAGTPRRTRDGRRIPKQNRRPGSDTAAVLDSSCRQKSPL